MRLTIDNRKLTINVDFEPLSISLAAQVDGPLVFAGYGITAADQQWDDYKGLDVKGKIVIVLRHEPQEMDPNSRFDGKNMTSHATFLNKAINARQHGARAVLFITDPNNHPEDKDAMSAAMRDIGVEDSESLHCAFHVRQLLRFLKRPAKAFPTSSRKWTRITSRSRST